MIFIPLISGPKWYPIIGNASLLRNETKKCGRQIDVFRAWQEKYKSSVIGLKLGRELVVVALDYPIIHQIHTSSEFDGRPDNFFLRLRTMGSRLTKRIKHFIQIATYYNGFYFQYFGLCSFCYFPIAD